MMDTAIYRTIWVFTLAWSIVLSNGDNLCSISSDSFQEQFCNIRNEVQSVKNQTDDIFSNEAMLIQLEADVEQETRKIEAIKNTTVEIHTLMEQLNNLTDTCSVCAVDVRSSPTTAANCVTDPCQNGGTCVEAGNDYYCVCRSEFEGKNCEDVTLKDSCHVMPCQNNGSCVSGNSSYSCTCNAGYTGIHCETLIDYCASNPCKNNATCNNFPTGFNCTCTPDYVGITCDVEVRENPCGKSPCTGVAKCEQLADNTHQCVCPHTDETKMDPCKKPVYVLPFGTCCIQDSCSLSTDCSAFG